MVSERRVDLKVIPGLGGKPGRTGPAPAQAGGPRRLFGRNADPPATGIGPHDAGLRASDLMILVYLGLTVCLMVAFQSHVRAWGALALAHLVAGALLLRIAANEPPEGGLPRLLRDFYPLPAMALFYFEYSWLTHVTGAGMHDALVVRLEQSLFGFQPSQELHRMWPWPWLSQYLHGAYFLYYLVPLSLAVTLYATRRWDAFQECLTTTMLAFLSCGLFFITFPVAGPYHHFGPPDLGSLGGGIAALAHALIQKGSSVGTAFPSSHVAVSVAVWISALRLSPRLFWVQALVVPALAVGTVYGGFHYALDSLAGWQWGVAAGILGPKLHAFLVQRLPRARARPKVALGSPLPKTGGRS